jgi:hypothetical protein
VIGTAGITDDSITQAKLKKNNGFFQRVATLTPAGTTQTIDWTDGVTQKLDVGSASGNVTLTLNNPLSGARYRLLVTQGAVARDLVWPAAVKWANGQSPLLSTANGSIDVVELYYDGANYYGDWDLAYA